MCLQWRLTLGGCARLCIRVAFWPDRQRQLIRGAQRRRGRKSESRARIKGPHLFGQRHTGVHFTRPQRLGKCHVFLACLCGPVRPGWVTEPEVTGGPETEVTALAVWPQARRSQDTHSGYKQPLSNRKSFSNMYTSSAVCNEGGCNTLVGGQDIIPTICVSDLITLKKTLSEP